MYTTSFYQVLTAEDLPLYRRAVSRTMDLFAPYGRLNIETLRHVDIGGSTLHSPH
jgi:hypothetical protein